MPEIFLAEMAGKPQKPLDPCFVWFYGSACPISHVPVVACQLVGIRTRGRTAARISRQVWGGAIINWQPEAKTGAPRFPRGTRLKATTERAFLVSICPPKADSPKRLVHLARRADGIPPIQSTAAHTGDLTRSWRFHHAGIAGPSAGASPAHGQTMSGEY